MLERMKKGFRMKKLYCRILSVFIAACLLFSVCPARVYAASTDTGLLTGWPAMTKISEDSAVVLDASNGAVLYAKDKDTKRYPASITKIMTCLLVLENAKLTDTVTMTETGMAAAYSGSSNCTPVLGEQFTVEQCLYMLMLKSANDIAAQLAEQVGGSVDKFADMMNARASELGCTGTHFNNPNGLPDTEHYTTAYDMALIMQECLKNETFRKIISTTSYTVPATNKTAKTRTYENHCKLIISSDTAHYYKYCIGGKTGYTDAALRTLAGAAEKDGVTLVAVTMHGATNQDFIDMADLFEYGFNNFKETSIDKTDDGGTAEGSVTLPSGISASSLKETETQNDAGQTVISYSYEGNPAGMALTVQSGTKSGADNAEGTEAGSGHSSGLNTKNTLMIVGTAFAAVLILLVISLIVRAKREKKRRERMRRRRMQRERERRENSGKRK